MTLLGCWRFTGTPTQNGVVTVGNNETTPSQPDYLLGEFAKASKSRINETIAVLQADGNHSAKQIGRLLRRSSANLSITPLNDHTSLSIGFHDTHYERRRFAVKTAI
ncbi:hypothetical protein LSAT2_018904 [Lamellibrachia satsuma]|nr:hypothetical protein LSAT2_018904 [Lamellibrachia satsuma]